MFFLDVLQSQEEHKLSSSIRLESGQGCLVDVCDFVYITSFSHLHNWPKEAYAVIERWSR